MKRTFKLFVAVILVVTFVISNVQVTSAANAPQWALQTLYPKYNNPQITIDVSAPVQRGEFANFLYQLLIQDKNTNYTGYVSGFKDYNTMSYTQKQIYGAMVRYGIFAGYNDGSLHMENTLTRQEAATVIVNLVNSNAAKFDTVNPGAYFYDIQNVWGRSAIIQVASYGLMSGTGNGNFSPNDSFTIVQVFQLGDNMLNKSQFVTSRATIADAFKSVFGGKFTPPYEGDNNGVYVQNITSNESSVNVVLGGTRRVTVSLSPSNAFNKNVRWQSSDTSVVSIKSNKDEGTTAYAELQGNKIGSATVTAITTDGSNRTYNFYINVQYDYSNIPVTGITVSKSSVALKVDGIESVYASVTPSNATKKGVSWKSSNSNVVTVFANGNNATVRGNSEGAAYVIATSDDGSFAGYIYVQVSKNTQDVKGVSLNKTYTELYVNGYETLISTILPPNASNTQVDWKSSNSNVASVSNSGFIRANAVGDAVITVTTRDGNYSASCYVRVSENSNTQISGVQLSKHSLSMSLNSKDYLYATVSPYGSNQSVNWVSSNESVVKVSSSGELTAVGTGKAYITVMTKTGGYVDVCEVTVGDTTGVNAVSSSLSFNSEVYQASDKTWILNLWIQIDNLVIDAKTVQDYLNLGGMSLYSNVSYNSPGLYQAWIKVPAQKGNYNVSLNGNSLWKYSTTSIEIR